MATRWLRKERITYIYSKPPTTKPGNVRFKVFKVYLAFCLLGCV
jgi:hypothetical protein